MKVLKSSSSRLRRFESRGNVAIIFALVGSLAMSLMGSTVELNRISSSKASLNSAADAAALAAKRVQMDNALQGASISQAAGVAAGLRVFAASAPKIDKGVTTSNANITWDADGSSRVSATGTMNLVFGGLVGMNTIPISSIGVATAGADRQLEVSLLLDTTASMFNKDGRPTTRFTQMRSSAKGFVNTLFDTITVPDRLRIAVVPWTTTVNIKGEAPAGWSAAAGTVRSPADFGTQTLPTTPMNRTGNISQSGALLTTQFAPVGWRGCISGTGETQAANDDAMTNMRWDALRIQPRVQNTTRRQQNDTYNRWCDNWQGCPPAGPPPPPGPPSPPPPPPPQTQGYLAPSTKKLETFAFLSFGKSMEQVACVNNRYICEYNAKRCIAGAPSITGLDCWQDDNNGIRNAYYNHTGNANCYWGGCQPNLTPSVARGCASDYNEVSYNAANGQWCSWVPKETWTSFKAITGPNLNCPMPMLGLSANRSQLIDTIDRLSPSPGGTHADVGLRWGLRSLSPTAHWTNFFGHTAPKPFNNSQATKIMILMTDGANEQAVNFPGYWGCSESGAPGCSTSPDRAALDARMLSWCTQIRTTYGIELYTVAVNVSDTNAVSLLAQCAGSPTRAFAVDASQLTATFAEIARSTMALRIKE